MDVGCRRPPVRYSSAALDVLPTAAPRQHAPGTEALSRISSRKNTLTTLTLRNSTPSRKRLAPRQHAVGGACVVPCAECCLEDEAHLVEQRSEKVWLPGFRDPLKRSSRDSEVIHQKPIQLLPQLRVLRAQYGRGVNRGDRVRRPRCFEQRPALLHQLKRGSEE